MVYNNINSAQLFFYSHHKRRMLNPVSSATMELLKILLVFHKFTTNQNAKDL